MKLFVLLCHKLNRNFPTRWIERRAFIERPPRPPELTLFQLKNKAFMTRLTNLEDVMERIRTEVRTNLPKVFQYVRETLQEVNVV